MRVVLAGSAAELGPVDAADLPVGEDYPADPVDAYGRSKLLATRSGLAERPPLEVICARIFNVIGPGLPATQAFGAFAARLAEPGPDPLDLPVGRLGYSPRFRGCPRRRPGACSPWPMHGRAGQVYHVGTGDSHAVGDGLETLIELSGRSVVPRDDPALDAVVPDPSIRVPRSTGSWRTRAGSRGSRSRRACVISGADVRDRQPINPWRGAPSGPDAPLAIDRLMRSPIIAPP